MHLSVRAPLHDGERAQGARQPLPFLREIHGDASVLKRWVDMFVSR